MMLNRNIRGVEVQIVDTLGSTMDQGKLLAREGFRGILMSYEQTAGRGIGPRKWHSPQGGLYFTWIMDYNHLDPITEFGEVLLHMAAIRTLKDYGVSNAKVKAPNDLFVNDLKIAGSLKWYFPFGMLLGFGLNLDLPAGSVDGIATSIHELTQFAPTPDAALEKMVGHSLDILKDFPDQLDKLKKEWTAVQLTLPDTDEIDRFVL